jgi:transposase
LVPSEILSLKDEDMRGIFYKENKATQTKYIATIKKAFSEYLALPDELVRKELELLNKDIYLFNILKNEINAVEKEMIELVKLTQGKYLLNQIKGLTDITIACYIGLIGDIKKYSDAKKIFSFAGLAPVLKESGGRIRKGLGITRAGNRYLRTLLFKMARIVMLLEPYFYSYYYHLREDMKKPYKKAIIGVAKKLNNTMFAMIRDKRSFDPPPYKRIYKNKPLAEI